MASTHDGTKVFQGERETGPKGRLTYDEEARAGGKALSTKTSDSRRRHHHRRRRRSPRPTDFFQETRNVGKRNRNIYIIIIPLR